MSDTISLIDLWTEAQFYLFIAEFAPDNFNINSIAVENS